MNSILITVFTGERWRRSCGKYRSNTPVLRLLYSAASSCSEEGDRGTKRHKSYGPFASYTYVTRFLAPHEHPLLSVINHPAIIQRFHLEDQCPKYFNTALSLLAKYVHTNIRIFHLQISHTSSDALKFSIRQNVPLHSTPDLTGKQFHIHPCELN